jgi:hypothetical protein
MILRRKAFWWDVVYREGARRKIEKPEIFRMVHAMRLWDFSRIRTFIERRFGSSAFGGNYGADCPMTVAELQRPQSMWTTG